MRLSRTMGVVALVAVSTVTLSGCSGASSDNTTSGPQSNQDDGPKYPGTSVTVVSPEDRTAPTLSDAVTDITAAAEFILAGFDAENLAPSVQGYVVLNSVAANGEKPIFPKFAYGEWNQDEQTFCVDARAETADGPQWVYLSDTSASVTSGHCSGNTDAA